MADVLSGFLGDFINVIMGIIDYIKELVKYFRDKNDGKDVEMPEGFTVKAKE